METCGLDISPLEIRNAEWTPKVPLKDDIAYEKT